jgi:hypothetical protein
MGLLYVSGVRFHDDDQDLIERRQRIATHRASLAEQFAEVSYPADEVRRSLSSRVSEAAAVNQIAN